MRFLAPLALLFIGGAAFEQRNVVFAVAVIATGSLAIVWLAARRAWFSLAASVAVLALAFLAVQGADLLGLVVETMRSGPER